LNPRNVLTFSGFQDRRIQPLCHLSKTRQVPCLRALSANGFAHGAVAVGHLLTICSRAVRPCRTPDQAAGQHVDGLARNTFDYMRIRRERDDVENV
jgi:hypothetical protein